jgi:predicted Zn-dependent peptidase
LNAQNFELLKQLSKSEITEVTDNSRLILSSDEKITTRYIHIQFKPRLHLQNRQKGINEICMRAISDELKNTFSDSTAANLQVFAEAYAIKISYDSLLNSGFFFEKLKTIMLEPDFSQITSKNYHREIIKNNFAPQLPPYEVLKRKNASIFYGSDHPLGEQINKEGISETDAGACENYYNSHLKNAEKDILVICNPQDTLLASKVRRLFNDFPRQTMSTEFAPPKIPGHTLLYFYESPQELMSSDTYLNLIYAKSDFNLDEKNYALYQFVNYSLSAHKIGLLDYSLTDTSAAALHTFSEMRTKGSILEHNMGLILKAKNLEKALINISRLMLKLRKEKLEPKRLQILKTAYLKKFESEINSPKNLVILQKDIARYRLPTDYFSDYNRKIQAINAADIQNFANRYLQSDKYTVTVFGKEKLLKDQLLFSSSQAEIKQYIDSEDDFKITPYKFSAEDVIRRFLSKTGAGEKNGSHFIAVKSRYEFEHETIETYTHIFRKNDKFLQKKFNRSDSTDTKPFDTKLFTGNKAYKKAGDNYTELKGTDSLRLLELKEAYPEQKYLNKETRLKLIGIDTVNQEPCYAVEIHKPQMLHRISYYSLNDSLKLKTETIKDSSIFATVYFDAYRPAGGKIKKLIPAKQRLEMNDYKVVSELDSVNFDIKLKNNLFKLD